MDRHPPEIDNCQVQAILAALAKILAKGLSLEQREAVLRGINLKGDVRAVNDELLNFQKSMFIEVKSVP